MLVILNRNNDIVANIKDRTFSEWKYEGANAVIIAGSGKEYIGMIGMLYDNGNLIGSGVIEEYAHNTEKNESSLVLFPLIYDLRNDFVSDQTGLIPYYDDQWENVLRDIINQYRSKTGQPLLSVGSFPATGVRVKYSFNHKTFLEAWNILVYTFLPKNMNVFVSPDGVIDIITTPGHHHLYYGSDIHNVQYSHNTENIINYVMFDNKRSDNHIVKTYQDTDSIAKYGKRVRYRDDARIKHVESADTMVGNFLAKASTPEIVVENIFTMRPDIRIYDKISIHNRSKELDDDLSVNGIVYLPGGKINIKVGTIPSRKILNQQDTYDNIDQTIQDVKDGASVPNYIKETYIDSVEVRSPTIAGNSGLFSGAVKVGADGVVIDGVNKLIKSSNYNATNKTGRQIKHDGQFFFGGGLNDYLHRDESALNLSGKIQAKAGSSISFDVITGSNKPANNATVGADWNSNLSNIPSNIENPDYIKSTYIDSTQIKAPNISGNAGYFSGQFKVGSNGVVIDGLNSLIRSSNFTTGISGRAIKNDGSAEFQNATVRGTIKATDGELTGLFRVKSPGYIEVYENSKQQIKMGIFTDPAIQFIDNGILVSELKGEYSKSITIAGQQLSLDCLSVSDDLYVGRDLAVGDDLVVNNRAWIGGRTYFSDITYHDNTLVMQGSSNIYLTTTNNKIIGPNPQYYIYCAGAYWYIVDADGIRKL